MGPSTSRDRGAAVRQQIEQAAVELIAERGWGAVSTRQLADRAGVGAGLVHYHYRSLDDALRTAVFGAVSAMIDEFVRLVADADDAEQALAQLWGMLDQHPADGPEAVLIVEAMLAALRDPDMRDGLAKVLHGFRSTVADRLRQTGVPEPEATAGVLAAVVDGIMLHRILADDLGGEVVKPIVGRMLQTPGGAPDKIAPDKIDPETGATP